MQTLFTRNIKIVILAVVIFAVYFANSAIVSRITTFTDGNILTASQLNSELNNILNTVNNLDNDNLSLTANISPIKVSAVIAGAGIVRDSGTGELAVNPDGTGLELSGDTVQIKNNGVTAAKFEQVAGLSVVGRSANSTGNVAAITAASDDQILRRSGTSIGFGALGASTVTSSNITDGTIVTADIAASQITSSLIADGTIATADIADYQITQGKLATKPVGKSSVSSGAYSTTSTGYIAVPNMTVTIVTTGRPVWVGIIPDGTTNSCYLATTSPTTPIAHYKLMRGSTSLGEHRLQTTLGTTVYGDCGSLWAVDTGAGTGNTTYTLQVVLQQGTNVQIGYAKIVAYEL